MKQHSRAGNQGARGNNNNDNNDPRMNKLQSESGAGSGLGSHGCSFTGIYLFICLFGTSRKEQSPSIKFIFFQKRPQFRKKTKTKKMTNMKQHRLFCLWLFLFFFDFEVFKPMISNVTKGFNDALIAYGQSCSGKTYSMLDKPKLNVVGVLSIMLEYMMKQPSIACVDLMSVEAFDHHVAKIALYGLYDPANQTLDVGEKKSDTGLDMIQVRFVQIEGAQDAHDKTIVCDSASVDWSLLLFCCIALSLLFFLVSAVSP